MIKNYKLSPDELLEYNKIKEINRALFFNSISGDDDTGELDTVHKNIFIKSLLKKRKNEKSGD